MGNRYDGTTLITPDGGTPEDQNKALLDLLGKSNDVAKTADQAISNIAATDANLSALASLVSQIGTGIIDFGGTSAATGYWEKYANGRMHQWGVFTTATAWNGAAPSFYAIDIEITLPTSFGSTSNTVTNTTGFRSTDAYPIRSSFSIVSVNKIKGSIECTSNYAGNKYINWDVWGFW